MRCTFGTLGHTDSLQWKQLLGGGFFSNTCGEQQVCWKGSPLPLSSLRFSAAFPPVPSSTTPGLKTWRTQDGVFSTQVIFPSYFLWAQWADLSLSFQRCSNMKWPITSSLRCFPNFFYYPFFWEQWTCFFQNSTTPDKKLWSLWQRWSTMNRSSVRKSAFMFDWPTDEYLQMHWKRNTNMQQRLHRCWDQCFLDMWVRSEAKWKDHSMYNS